MSQDLFSSCFVFIFSKILYSRWESRTTAQSLLQHVPKILNSVTIWTLWWSIHVWKICVMLPEPFFQDLSLINPGIVILGYAWSGKKKTSSGHSVYSSSHLLNLIYCRNPWSHQCPCTVGGGATWLHNRAASPRRDGVGHVWKQKVARLMSNNQMAFEQGWGCISSEIPLIPNAVGHVKDGAENLKCHDVCVVCCGGRIWQKI